MLTIHPSVAQLGICQNPRQHCHITRTRSGRDKCIIGGNTTYTFPQSINFHLHIINYLLVYAMMHSSPLISFSSLTVSYHTFQLRRNKFLFLLHLIHVTNLLFLDKQGVAHYNTCASLNSFVFIFCIPYLIFMSILIIIPVHVCHDHSCHNQAQQSLSVSSDRVWINEMF